MADDWAGGATIGGLAVPSEPDMVRLRADRHARIQAQLESQGIDALVLLGSGNVAYATGADSPGEDSGRAGLFRPVAIVVRGESEPHLYTAYWDGVPAELSSRTSTTASPSSPRPCTVTSASEP
jgi:Xaa-Pro aminopeptidase